MVALPADIAAAAEKAETKSFEPLPAGEYRVVLEKAEFRTAQTGTKGLNFTYKVIEGPGDSTEHKGRLLWDTCWFGDRAAWRLKMTFSAFGFPTTADTDLMVGKSVIVSVTREEQERGKNAGRMVNNIANVSADPAQAMEAAQTATAMVDEF